MMMQKTITLGTHATVDTTLNKLFPKNNVKRVRVLYNPPRSFFVAYHLFEYDSDNFLFHPGSSNNIVKNPCRKLWSKIILPDVACFDQYDYSVSHAMPAFAKNQSCHCAMTTASTTTNFYLCLHRHRTIPRESLYQAYEFV